MSSSDTIILSQKALAALLDISRGWLSEATAEGKKVKDGSFDPSAYAVYDEGGNFAQYEVPSTEVVRLSGGTPREEQPDMIPAGHNLSRTETEPSRQETTVLQRLEPHNEQVTVSLLPPEANLSRTGGYVAAGYAAGHAVSANPAVAPMMIDALGTGAGVLLGYEIGESYEAALFGGLCGLLVTEGGRKLTRTTQPQYLRA